ncbi:hypothetical protein COCNU_scaffold009866G000010 [Cocos nucifera]|nr:hypothetical protein [Cocos nucifera]
MVVSSLTLPNEDAIPTPLDQDEVVEKKKGKNKVFRKKIRRMTKNSGGEGSGQEQASLDDQKVIQTLMRGNVLPHIINKMVRMKDVERFDESFATYLELRHYLLAHLKVADLYQAKAFLLQEAQAENERVWVEVDHLKVASEIQTIEVKHLQEALWKEEEASTGLSLVLILSVDKRRKAEEEVGTEKEQVVEVFKSSKAMEDIKIAFT